MKMLILSLIASFFFCVVIHAQWEKTEYNFQHIPINIRPNPLWFWNNAQVEKEELKNQMVLCKSAGYGGLSILPFGKNFKPTYLSNDYFDVYKTCIEEAEKLNLTLWIYDEYGFPSGTAGDHSGDGLGRFKQKFPTQTMKRLDKTEYVPIPASKFELKLPQEQLMAIVAMDSVSFKRIDLQKYISDNILTWYVPLGNWKVFIFTCVADGNSIVDYLSPEAVNLYIGMTHDEYYKRFSKYFGTTIKGTFFDEPTLYQAQGRPWTPEFNKKFESKFGFNPALYYPALWYNIGDETEEARNYLFGFRSQLYAEGYTKQVNEWSKNHGVLATGHQDNEEVVNCVGTSGDLMKCFKYLEVPGIDKIGGNRPAENFYKIISSAAYNWDHSLVMSETYGAMGNISWDEIFGIAMDQYVKGVNILIPHAVWYDVDKVTFLPELSTRNAIYADSLEIFNNYLSRLNVLMQNTAKWQGDIAVLYPIHAMQSGHYFDGPLNPYKGGVEIPDLDYVEVGVTLFDSLCYDFMFLHPEILNEKCNIVKSKLQLNNAIQYNSFSVLVIPGCKTIDLNNLKIAQDFANKGGVVIFTTQLPEKATLLKDDLSVKSIINRMFTQKSVKTEYGKVSSSGNIHFIEEPNTVSLQKVLKQSENKFGLHFSGKERVKTIHKKVDNKNIWFLANPDNSNKNIKIELQGNYNLKSWDPHSGIISDLTIAKNKSKNRTTVELEIGHNRSLFLVEY